MSQRPLPKLIIIVGPTATNKSQIAIQLAQKYNSEILSADSRKIYKYVRIGIHAPQGEWKKVRNKNKFISNDIVYHLVDFVEPTVSYTAAQYKQDALKILKNIHNKQRHRSGISTPIMVGGTGLYINAIKNNLLIPNVSSNAILRAELEKKIQKNGLDSVYKYLLSLDPMAAHYINPTNPRRIIRAIEVCVQTQLPFSNQRKIGPPLFNTLTIGTCKNIQHIETLIDKRVEQMFSEGLIAEVEQLINKLSFAFNHNQSSDYIINLPILTSSGYKEVVEYLSGEFTLNETIKRVKQATRKYAKKQITWFKKDKTIKWIENYNDAAKLTDEFLKN